MVIKSEHLVPMALRDLFIHDARQLGEHVPVVSFHLLLVLQLVLLNEMLIHIQSLTAGFCKLPAENDPVLT